MSRFLLALLSTFVLLGCSAQHQPAIEEPAFATTKQEESTVHNELSPSLYVLAPKGAKIRIMNIKERYHDHIELKKGNYLVDVSKQGFQTYHKWVQVEKPTTLKITLSAQTVIQNFSWEYDHQKFYTLYDPKTELIWALPSDYVDYVQKYKPQKFLTKTIAADSPQWPRIDRTKLDTIIYRAPDALVLYKKSKQDSLKDFYQNLHKLSINTMNDDWRLPTKNEIVLNNPFKHYQQYFQLIWDKGNIVKMNVPVLYKDAKTLKALGYKKNKQLYNSSVSNYITSINNPTSIALVTPVKSKDSEIDNIVYSNSSISQKFQELYTLLNSNEKAIKILLGDPKLKNITYNKKTKKVEGIVYSTTNDFQTKFSFKLAESKYADMREKLLDERLIPSIAFSFTNGKLHYKSLKLKTNKLQAKEAYMEAKRSKNINFYREFINMYPNTPEAAKLKQMLKEEYRSKYVSIAKQL
ncbi:hypothetical protein [Sulfurimonas sp. C5]|uniref:hypothetical protein n=1 Tax=Sulfurimonas sp. C5 TaxID=3036947 RepID=UPI0024578387|nr:hypothetical protein [Sulfurimonas sp. C5]MDH4945256.1 hypothetical protein [Sulfurimonas sp. C5]